MNKLFAYVFLLLLLIAPTVSAVLDQNVQTSNEAVGYVIEYPPMKVIPFNQSISFSFHIFNASTGGFINDSSLPCNFHLYNNQGNHILRSDLAWTGDHDYFVVVDPLNFTYIGNYGYNVQCGDPTIGGFDSVPIIVTPQGHDPLGDIPFTFAWIMFFAILFSLIFLFLYAIGGMLSLRFDVLDVALNIGAFFVLFGYKVFASDYLGVQIINDILDLAFKISVWTNVVIPLLGFVLTLLLGPLLLRKYPQVFGRMPGNKPVYSGQGAMS